MKVVLVQNKALQFVVVVVSVCTYSVSHHSA